MSYFNYSYDVLLRNNLQALGAQNIKRAIIIEGGCRHISCELVPERVFWYQDYRKWQEVVDKKRKLFDKDSNTSAYIIMAATRSKIL